MWKQWWRGWGRAGGTDGQWMGAASKRGPGPLCQRSCAVSGESGLQGPQLCTVFLGLRRPMEVRPASWAHKCFGWMGCNKAQAHTCSPHKFSTRADENRLIQSLPGQWIGTGYDILFIYLFMASKNLRGFFNFNFLCCNKILDQKGTFLFRHFQRKELIQILLREVL